MRPILYEQNERVFESNGIAVLHDTISSEVTEVRNAEFELELKYPIGGEWAKELTLNRYILVKPNDYDDPHAFRIYEAEKEVDSNQILVKGVTKTDELSGNVVKPLSIKSATPSQAWEQVKRAAVDPISYNFISDIQTSKDTSMDIRNVLNAVAGEEGSFIDTWGGEIKRTNNTIFLYSKRGKDHVTTIRPRKNLKNVKVKSSMAGKFTRILPYVTFTPEGENEPEQVIYGDIVKSPHYDDYFVKRIVPLDLSSEFNNSSTAKEGEQSKKKAPTPAQITAKAQSYFTSKNKDADKPDLQVEVEMIPLQDSTEWDRRIIQALEKIQLCDTIDVYVPKIDCDVTVKVRKIVYDSLRERIIKIEASSSGSGRASLADQQKAQWQDMTNKMVNNALYGEKDGLIHTILTSANNKNKNFYGPEEPPREKVSKDDLWFKPVGGEGEVEMWRFDGENWVLVIDANFGQKVTDKVNDAIEAAKRDINADIQTHINEVISDAAKHWKPDLTPVQNALDEKLRKIDDDINVKVTDIKDRISNELNNITVTNPNLISGTVDMSMIPDVSHNPDNNWTRIEGIGGTYQGMYLGGWRYTGSNQTDGRNKLITMAYPPGYFKKGRYVWSFYVKTDTPGFVLDVYCDPKVNTVHDIKLDDVSVGNFSNNEYAFRFNDTEEHVISYHFEVVDETKWITLGLSRWERDTVGATLDTYKWKIEDGARRTSWCPNFRDPTPEWSRYKQTNESNLSELNRRITDVNGNTELLKTRIDQTSNAIALKADKQEFDNLTGELNNTKAELSLVPGKISTAVSNYEATVNGKLSQVSTSIDQKTNEIKIAAQNLEKKVDGNATSTAAELRVIKDSISAKVSRTDLDTISGKVTSVETNLNARIDGIQTSVDKVTRDVDGKITTAVSSAITQSNDSIMASINSVRDYVDTVKSTDIINAKSEAKSYTDTKFNLVDGKIQTQIDNRLTDYARTSDVATRVTQEAGKIKTELTSVVDDKIDRNEKFQSVLQTVDIYKRTLGETQNGIATSISQIIQNSDEIRTVITNASQSTTNFIADTDTFISAKMTNFTNGVNGYSVSDRPGNYGRSNYFYLSKEYTGNYTDNSAFVSLPLVIDKMEPGEKYTFSCQYELDSRDKYRRNKPLNVELQIINNSGYVTFSKIINLDPGNVLNGSIKETFNITYDNIFDNINGYNGRYPFRIKLTGEGRFGIKEIMLVRGDTVGKYQPSGGVSSTVVSQKNDAWALSLAGPKDVITAINADKSGLRLKGKSIVLDGDVTATGTAFIKESWIENLNASKITAGELNAAKVKVINIDASNIVSGTMTAKYIKGGILSSINGDVKFNLDGSNIQFYKNGSIQFHSGNNSIWRQTTDGIHTAFIHFNEVGGPRSKGGGSLYAAIGVTSSSDGINSSSSGRFSGIRCFRASKDWTVKNDKNHKLGSHERSIDQIEIYGDEIIISDTFDQNRGFYMRTETMPADGYIDLWKAIRYCTSGIWHLANIYGHLRNVGWDTKNANYKNAINDDLRSINSVYPDRFKVPLV
nr:MAG TPA: tail protein [Caudoviricetes sp.]